MDAAPRRDPASQPLLVAAGLGVHYHATAALAEVDVDVRGGEVHAIVGENGARKIAQGGPDSGPPCGSAYGNVARVTYSCNLATAPSSAVGTFTPVNTHQSSGNTISSPGLMVVSGPRCSSSRKS
jgi:hypothetical protein